MRNVLIADLDGLPVDVLPIGTVYPADHLLPWHEHRRAQLLYGATGTMLVETADGSWTVPADRAVLIPPGTPHEVRFLDVTTWSLYIEPAAVPWWPSSCTVIEIGTLLRELLRTANEFDGDYDARGRDGAVIALALHELQRVGPVPLHIGLPEEATLRRVCRDYLARPDVSVTNADWAATAHCSERALDRRFRDATGISPGIWRARARLLASLPMLQRRSVTDVAGILGYSTPAAFTAAFTRAFGRPPTRYR